MISDMDAQERIIMNNTKARIALTYAPSEQQFLPVPPLGISALSQHLINHGIDNDVVDLELELWLSKNGETSEYAQKSVDELEIDKLPIDALIPVLDNYDIVTFSIMGKRQLAYVMAIARKLKKSHRHKSIVLGGAFFNDKNGIDVINTWKEIIDYVIVGEGWSPMLALISSLVDGIRRYDIPGVVCIGENGESVYNKGTSWSGDLPIPNYRGINKQGYVLQQSKLYGFQDDSIIYHILVGDRRCPYRCSFCRISENTKSVKGPTDIADEMIELNKQCGADRFSLVCNEMNPTKQYYEEFLDRLLSYDKKLYWFSYLRPNKLDRETLMKARRAGCVLIRYGVETGSQKILDHMNKVLYVDEMEQIMKDTHEAGIWNHINIVTGYLHEDEKDVQLTLDFLDRNKDYIDSVRVNPFYVPIGSPIHNNPGKYGITLRKNTGSYVQFDEPLRSWEEKQVWIKKVTDTILKKCIECEINFAGILPFLVAAVVAHFDDVKTAKEWIKQNHSYLFLPVSPDTAKWRLAHPDRLDVEINKWSEIAGKRSSNYQTLSDMNDDAEEDSY